MSPLLSHIQTFLPYLLAIWAIPFIVIAIKMMRRPTGARLKEFSYTKNPALFSAAERSFLGVLEQAVGKNYRIFGKVSAADIVGVRAMADQSASARAFNQISPKHFDFILCDKKDLAVSCAIELNDKFHDCAKGQDRDASLEIICKAISLPLVQLQARRDYAALELRNTILAALNEPSEAGQTGAEKIFSVGPVADSHSNDRPWTMN